MACCKTPPLQLHPTLDLSPPPPPVGNKNKIGSHRNDGVGYPSHIGLPGDEDSSNAPHYDIASPVHPDTSLQPRPPMRDPDMPSTSRSIESIPSFLPRTHSLLSKYPAPNVVETKKAPYHLPTMPTAMISLKPRPLSKAERYPTEPSIVDFRPIKSMPPLPLFAGESSQQKIATTPMPLTMTAESCKCSTARSA